MPKPRGRKTSLTRPVLREVLRCVGVGMPIRWAAASAGVTVQSVRYWVRRGKAGDGGLYEELLTKLDGARGKFLAVHLKNIEKQSKKYWPASAWLIERSFPEYSPQRVEIARMMKDIKRLEALLKGIAPNHVDVAESESEAGPDRTPFDLGTNGGTSEAGEVQE